MGRRGSLFSVALLGATLTTAGCKLDPECFGANECTGGRVCSNGECVAPDAGPPIDAGAPVDAATDAEVIDVGPPIDAGIPDFGFPDVSFPDAQRPDLGFPDAGIADTGFAEGPRPGGLDPVVGTSTPAAVAGGFLRLESVMWRPATSTAAPGAVLVSDLGADIVYRLDPSAGFTSTIERAPSSGTNGLALDPATGELFAAEHGSRSLTVQPLGGGVFFPVVTSFWQYAFNSPNDIVVRSDGTLYFTDPPFGLDGRPRELPFNGLFRTQTFTGTITAEWMGVPGVHAPDGLALSPDEQTLYMTELGDDMIVAFDVLVSGRLANRRGFVRTQGVTPNGLAVDEEGNVYVGTSVGVEVYASNGFFWGVIGVPGPVNDLTFAPPDRQRLFATSTSTVWSMDVTVPGVIR